MAPPLDVPASPPPVDAALRTLVAALPNAYILPDADTCPTFPYRPLPYTRCQRRSDALTPVVPTNTIPVDAPASTRPLKLASYTLGSLLEGSHQGLWREFSEVFAMLWQRCTRKMRSGAMFAARMKDLATLSTSNFDCRHWSRVPYLPRAASKHESQDILDADSVDEPSSGSISQASSLAHL
ncbi:hypothetical protein B0H12DRAFT_1231140 [Mycena haematopus]|nr:hypothetical protein B0H12DRAFT_1231140 [Mycena haematopus]